MVMPGASTGKSTLCVRINPPLHFWNQSCNSGAGNFQYQFATRYQKSRYIQLVGTCLSYRYTGVIEGQCFRNPRVGLEPCHSGWLCLFTWTQGGVNVEPRESSATQAEDKAWLCSQPQTGFAILKQN
ncbi:hypothetical protein GQ53DRAFT_547267 [Thozetella sp. PMI_491]|nr:hypothetical protein GQ53DRAFT_547267 [Thozetella sp. PMI_491]